MSLEESSQNVSTPPSEHDAPKLPVSERKVQANRKNSLNSTGPKTHRGKRSVSRNAIKHGLFVRQVVIEGGLDAEKVEEFHALVERLLEHYEPVGPIEETLVETLASCLWRKARILRAENGEIRKRLDSAAVDLTLRNSDKANLELAMAKFDGSLFAGDGKTVPKLRDRWSLMQISQINLRDHPVGLVYLSSILRIAKSEIINEGCISQSIRDQIFCAFCFWDYAFAIAIANSDSQESTMQDPTTQMSVSVRDKEDPIIVLIDEMMRNLRIFLDGAVARQKLAVEAETRCFSLPPADVTDRLLRYEGHLDRQLYRAMDELERLQCQRKGEKVPPADRH
jgi:hypothetical protein